MQLIIQVYNLANMQIVTSADNLCKQLGPRKMFGFFWIQTVCNLVMQFHLNVMTCLLCTSLPLDSCSGAENHKGSFWISIRQIYTYHRVNLFNCAKDLSVQLLFSI